MKRWRHFLPTLTCPWTVKESECKPASVTGPSLAEPSSGPVSSANASASSHQPHPRFAESHGSRESKKGCCSKNYTETLPGVLLFGEFAPQTEKSELTSRYPLLILSFRDISLLYSVYSPLCNE